MITNIFFLFYIFKKKKISVLFNDEFFFSLYIVLVLQYDYVSCIILSQFILFYRAIYLSCKINFASRPFSFYRKYLSIYLFFVSSLFVKEKKLSQQRKIQLNKTNNELLRFRCSYFFSTHDQFIKKQLRRSSFTPSLLSASGI